MTPEQVIAEVSGHLAERHSPKDPLVPLANFLAMLNGPERSYSDAEDMLLRRAGGPEAIAAHREARLERRSAYERDLTHSTEVVLKKRRPKRLPSPGDSRSRPGGGSLARVTAGAIRLGRTVGAAITNHRVLGTAEAFPLFWIAMSLLALAALAVFLPHVVAWTAASFFTLLSLMLLLRSWRLRRAGRKVER